MNSTAMQEIIKYVTPPKTVFIMGIVTVLLAPIMYFVVKAVSADELKAAVTGIVMAVMGIVFCCIRYCYLILAKKSIKQAEKDGKETFLLDSYKNGKKFLDGRVICGKHYIFGKVFGTIADLSEVKAIYCETKRYKGVPTTKTIVIKLNNNKKLTLCGVNCIEERHPPFDEIIDYIKMLVPDADVIQ